MLPESYVPHLNILLKSQYVEINHLQPIQPTDIIILETYALKFAGKIVFLTLDRYIHRGRTDFYHLKFPCPLNSSAI